MEYKDLEGEAKAEYEKTIEEGLKPLEKRGIVKRIPSEGKPLWGTSANIKKLMVAVGKGLENKGKDSQFVMINGSKVLLTIMAFLIFQNTDDEKTNKLLDEYLKEVLKG
jgi:hypothetical protein